MTDQLRNALRVAQAFARVLIDSIDHEIKGGDSSWREESAMQLAAALRNLEPPVYNPDINRPSTQPYPQTEWPRCEKCGGIAVSNASGDITRTCIHCGSIVKPAVPHIDSDRTRGPSDWDRECQESRRLNR